MRQEEQDVEKSNHCRGSGINIADNAAFHCARVTFLRVRGVLLAKTISMYVIKGAILVDKR